MLLLNACRSSNEEDFRAQMESWYGLIQSKSFSCDAVARALENWEARHGASFLGQLTIVVERASKLEGDERRAYLTEISVKPPPRARSAMNRCLEHPKAGQSIRRMAERLSSLFRLELEASK